MRSQSLESRATLEWLSALESLVTVELALELQWLPVLESLSVLASLLVLEWAVALGSQSSVALGQSLQSPLGRLLEGRARV